MNRLSAIPESREAVDLSPGILSGVGDRGASSLELMAEERRRTVDAARWWRVLIAGINIPIADKEFSAMARKTTKRHSKSWRKHVRRMKQQARKSGTVDTASRPVVSIPQAPKQQP